jgi:hypothetical protein
MVGPRGRNRAGGDERGRASLTEDGCVTAESRNGMGCAGSRRVVAGLVAVGGRWYRASLVSF